MKVKRVARIGSLDALAESAITSCEPGNTGKPAPGKVRHNVHHTLRRVLRPLRTFGIAATLLGGVCAAQAGQLWCQGTLTNLFIYSDGYVNVQTSWLGNYVRLCNLNQAVGPVSITTCMAWVSLVRSAVQRNSTALFYYAEASACNAIPNYSAASPQLPDYVMMVN